MLIVGQIIRRNSDTLSQRVNGEYIIVEVSTSKLYKLNPTAETIWKFLWKPRKVSEIIDKVSEDYSISKNKAKKDVFSFIKSNLGALLYSE